MFDLNMQDLAMIAVGVPWYQDVGDRIGKVVYIVGQVLHG